MKKEYGVYVVSAVIVVLLAALIWWAQARSGGAGGQVATSTGSDFSLSTSTPPSASASSQPTPAPQPSKYQFTLVPGESIASWNFAGTYKDGGTLEARTRAEIARMKGFLTSGADNKYELYVSIANQYELLGEGKQEFIYLNYALSVDSEHTGLAWHNMGKLLERLGAYKSARVAYDAMLRAQSTSQYILARLEFLKAHMPEDTDAIAQAEAELKASTW